MIMPKAVYQEPFLSYEEQMNLRNIPA